MDDDAYYVPPHLSDPFTKDEMVRYVEVYAEHDAADGDADGFIEVDAVEALMLALDEKPTAKKREELIAACDPADTGQLGFLDVLRVMARFRFRRDPFGGKRSINDDLPLPVRIATEYDKPCIQHPDRRAQIENPADPTTMVMRMIFNRHDIDGSGEIEMHEVESILAENGLTFDQEELESVFARFDVDNSGTLDFSEFVEMMADLKAESAIVENRGSHYTVPPALAKHFSEEEMADLKVHFGMFDADGGGSIAADELMGVLEDMGMEPTEEQVDEIIDEVDKDGSGEIEFGEFVDLMHKVQTGAIEMGILAQAIMDSGAGQKLAKEVRLIKKALEEGPPPSKQLSKEAEEANLWNDEDDDGDGHRDDENEEAGEDSDALANANPEAQGRDENAVAAAGEAEAEEEESNWVEGLLSLEIERRDATTCTASLLGPENTPYQGHVMVIEIKVGDDYPFAPPVHAAFTHRVLHVNFAIGLDGQTSMPQLLQFWDAEWGIAKLLRYIRELLIEPNLALLPPDYAEGTRHDPALQQHHQPAHHSGGEEDASSSYWEQGYPQGMVAPMAGPPAGDLRRRKGRNRFLAELVCMFCEQRAKYDRAAMDFCRQFAQRYSPAAEHHHHHHHHHHKAH